MSLMRCVWMLGLIFSACQVSVDSTDPNVLSTPGNNPPLIGLISGDGLVSSDTILAPSHMFDIAFAASKGSAALQNYTINIDYYSNGRWFNGYNLIKLLEPTPDPISFKQTVENVQTEFHVGLYRYNVIIMDYNNLTDTASFTIELSEQLGGGPVVTLLPSDSTISDGDEINPKFFFDLNLRLQKGLSDLDSASLRYFGTSSFDVQSVEIRNENDYVLTLSGLQAPEIQGEYTYRLTVTDKNGMKGSATWTMNVQDGPFFNEFPIEMGAQNNPIYGSFCDADNGNVLTLSQVFNGLHVDIIYHYSQEFGAAFFSPNDIKADTLFGGSIANWTTRNQTKIQKWSDDPTLLKPDYVDTMSITGSTVENIESGDIIVYETEMGNRGIFLVTELDDSIDGYIRSNRKYLVR